MSQKAIIHTTTRVIRRLTTDDTHQIRPDETMIDMGEINLTLAGGPWKLDVDNVTKIQATQIEADEAFTLPQSIQLIELLQALTDVRDDTNFPPKLRLVCARLRTWFDRKTRID